MAIESIDLTAVLDLTDEQLKLEKEDYCAEEQQDLLTDKQQELDEFTKKWVSYGECITVEFDTEAGTCVVLENTRR